MIYGHNQFNAKSLLIDEEIHGWERQCIELSLKRNNKKKYITCNVYKPPNLLIDDLNLFNNEFTNSLSYLSQFHRDTYVCGDFNIDLLQIYTNERYYQYFENIISCGFVPRITLPTRICDSGNRSTLIDNIFTNIIDENKMHTSGNLLNAITDHKAIFTLVDSIKYNDPPPKFIKTEVNDDKSLQTFVDELKELNIYESLDTNLQNNPNQNYDTFEKLLLHAKTKHLTTKTR